MAKSVGALLRAAQTINRIRKSFDRYAPSNSSPTEAITDLLTDIRHYSDRYNVDFFACLDTSYRHYLEERKGAGL
jgi:hypothetical protein